MSFAPTSRFFRSTSFRISAIYALLLVFAAVAAATGSWFAARGAAERELRNRISIEVHAVGQAIADEGLAGAVADIAARAERPGALEFRLVDPRGRLLIGELPAERAPVGWALLRLPDKEPEEGLERVLVRTEVMPDGSRLSVGDDLDHAESIRDAVLMSLLWVGAFTVLSGLAAGFVLTSGALRRMEAVVATVAAVGHGDMDARAVVDGRGDDIDELASGVNAMLDRISLLLASVRRVSSAVAHDLRTPLSHVRQHLETAEAAPSLEACRSAVRDAGTGIERALRIFDAMLRLAEIEAGAARARFATFDLGEAAERMGDAYRFDIEDSGRALEIRAAPVMVLGDADLIDQALANLIENALAHTPVGARIILITDETPQGPRLIVADNGPGVPESMREAMLAPFAQGDPSRSKGRAGLGLAIAAAIAHLHDGTLALDDAHPGLRAVILLGGRGPT